MTQLALEEIGGQWPSARIRVKQKSLDSNDGGRSIRAGRLTSSRRALTYRSTLGPGAAGALGRRGASAAGHVLAPGPHVQEYARARRCGRARPARRLGRRAVACLKPMPSARLLAQADYFAGLAAEDADALATYGWSAERTQELAALRQKTATAFADSRLAREDTIAATQRRDEALSAAKLWLRRATLVASNAFMLDPAKADDFRLREGIGRAVPRVVARLDLVVKAFERHQTALAAWGGGAELLADGKSVLGALRDAEKTKGVEIAALPSQTRDFYRHKGELYVAVKRLQRAGRSAF
ncbi:MAG: hypothetical protein HY744_11335 [Deltaproteobacteria bacterium]|nr:hypothetical protein [Deltaproteobacteria bacterium]